MSVGLTSENKVQTSLVVAVNSAGGYAYKASNAHTTGVPDLSITPPPGITVYPMHIKMEVKFEKVTQRTRGITVELSTPQFEHLEKTHEANGIACWVAAYTFTDCQKWGLYLLHHSLGKKFTMRPNHCDKYTLGHFIKERGEPWDVKSLCTRIIRCNLEEDLKGYANWTAP